MGVSQLPGRLNGLVSQTDGSGTQTYFLHDGLDSIRELTNSSGTGVSDYFYDAFGADRGSTWSQRSTTTEYTFNGQQDDPTLGLYYLRARYYDPYTGRFLSKDPFQGTLANPASQHYYTYAQNNPINYTDPSGEILDTFLDAAFILFDIYKLAADNVFGNCDNLNENLVALGADAGGLLVPFATGGGLAVRAGIKGVETAVRAEERGFRSYSALKRVVGPAGKDLEWHHIVEQTTGNIARYGSEKIQNTGNIIRLSTNTHRQISGYYSSKAGIAGGLTVRQWLSTQSLEAQREFGLDVLRKVGVLK